ncbi:MAG: Ig-like domain-containing protein [Bacteroidales bacterium]|nr:Ig-like domain-containing protein [Bacteroidales bacterium]
MFKHFILFALLGLSLASCSNFNSLKVKKTNFGDEVLRAQNLVFTFNKELLNDSSLINRWDSVQYLKFEPPIPGKFMWTGKSELTFSPMGSLLPATNYTATLSDELLRYKKEKYSIKDKPLTFHTPFLNIISINTFWSLSEETANQVEVCCQVNLNNPVSPVKLKPLLKLLVGGKEMPYRIITQNDAETIELAFPFAPLEYKYNNFKQTFNSGWFNVRQSA